ncbi:hypothetical protein [Niastella sp. OAS944]|uniref:hypothetical protein n=1 Tax=Niastella sp. OAS944 TaxID=2664089 RepID=UPI003488BD16|nr:hypothetical protein [Chitinophagaceae bacterium OAS944]
MTSDNKKKIKSGNKDRLLHLSLDLYATFYPKYYLVETLLKNRLFQLFKERLGANWFTLQINSSDDSNLIKREAEFILQRKPKGFILNEKGFLIEVGLALWVEFFSKDFYKSVKGLPIQIFPLLPPTIKRKDLYQKLNEVKDLRNQLFHHRLLPITEPEQLKYLNELGDANNTLIELLTWLDAPISGLELNEFENKAAEIRELLA